MNNTKIEEWLKLIFFKKHDTNLKINFSEAIAKGDNYIGDVFLINFRNETPHNSETFDIVLKASKNSQIIRERTPMHVLCLNEIFCYDKVFTYFLEFQNELAIKDIFDNIPKCFGTVGNEEVELIALENLKTSGYYLCNRKETMPRIYLNLVVEAYGKLHATSAAIAVKRPEKFQAFVDHFQKLMSDILLHKAAFFDKTFSGMDEVYNLLKDDLDEQILNKWLNQKESLMTSFMSLINNTNSFKVISHGDCWNNNFMFKSDTNNQENPSRVVIIDWQMAKLSTPVADLAHFLFTCISPDDLKDIDVILKNYYISFAEHLRRFGEDPDHIYSEREFVTDWQKYCKFEAMSACPSTLKICLTDEDEIPDMVKTVNDGKHVLEMFKFTIRDQINYKRRMKPVVEYLALNNFI